MKKVFLTLLLLSGMYAEAAVIETGTDFSQLTAFIQEQVSGTTENIKNSEVTAPSSAESWYFRRFLMRIRAKFGFEVPLLAELKVVPEVELFFQKDLPQGWDTYKP